MIELSDFPQNKTLMPYSLYELLLKKVEDFSKLCKIRRKLEKRLLINERMETDKILVVPKRRKDESLEDWFERCAIVYNLGK